VTDPEEWDASTRQVDPPASTGRAPAAEQQPAEPQPVDAPPPGQTEAVAGPVQPGQPEAVAAPVPPGEPEALAALAQSPDSMGSPPLSAIDRFSEPSGTVSFGFNLQKIPEHGEDSDPILLVSENAAVVGVFDGMGGAGGTVYQTPDGPFSGAYLASRIARDVVESSLRQVLNGPALNGPVLDGPALDGPVLDAPAPAAPTLNAPTMADEMQRAIKNALQARLVELRVPPSGLRSRLLRALPSTMAVAVLVRAASEDPTWTCHLFWAGDSRVYAFDPGSGAHQLTIDDLRNGGDAMANLREDSVVSNALSADTEFSVRTRTVQLTEPFLLTAVTDGCFGYVGSPMHFEDLVISTMRDAADQGEWSAALQQRISAVTGDDAAAALVAYGADVDTFSQLFAARAAAVQERWVVPLDALAAEEERLEQALGLVRDEQVAARSSLWAAYEPDYARYLDEASAEQERT